MARPSPPLEVISAFRASGTLARLGGNVVLKPLDVSESELEWQAYVLGSLRCDGFRVARPVRSRDGSLLVGGWTAWEAVEGRHEEGRWLEIIELGERLHSALVNFDRPDFIAQRTDPWAVGDRVAWGELPADQYAHVKHLSRLAGALRPVEATSQLIHGDLTGNVLFAEQLEPAVIDFSPYWRPKPFASAIVVADALVWEGADESVLDAVAHLRDFDQYLLRALIYRAVTDRLFRLSEPIRPDDGDPYLPAVELACRLATREQ